jgi:anti-sigma B factor antagonist
MEKNRINSETVLINLGTELDNNNAHEMIKILTEVNSEGYKKVILDMTNMEFLSSSGVGAILGMLETFREQNGDIILCNLSDKIYHILTVLDLQDYLTIRESVDTAVKS